LRTDASILGSTPFPEGLSAGEQFLALINTSFEFARGRALPLGATLERGGINFSVFSEHATGVTLVLYQPGAQEPIAEFPLDPGLNRTGHVWHAFVAGINPGIEYGYRLRRDRAWAGNWNAYPDSLTHKFDPGLVLLDPYAKGCVRVAGAGPAAGARDVVRRSVIVDTDFDWGHDQPLDYPLADSIIYELHVRAFTKHASSSVKAPGTFAGLTEKIPYLQSLGITAVELMPVVEFDEHDNPRTNPHTQLQLVNFWGYHPLSFFAPHLVYGSENTPDSTLREMKNMVTQFHAAGIEVILDVVFNHTGESGDGRRTSSLRGIDNAVYYLVDPITGAYRDYSGCGNTINCNHPVVRDFVLDCLRYWVTEVHIDGFRFDLASILGRGQDGAVLANPPLIERIAADPILAKTKLIAEAWDACGLYQVGDFPEGIRWTEWNGRYRDDLRNYLAGAPGMVPALATRLTGSADLYQAGGRAPYHSINFVTCHDGFPLADLVSYNEKHNEANGENNRDGSSDNYSWNCGCEGPTEDEEILRLRQRQARNFATLLMVSHGVPMLLFGDEMGRTQNGNNNLYCQDSELSWVDWSLAEENESLVRFFRQLIALRRAHRVLRRATFISGTEIPSIQIEWHGTKLAQPDWSLDSHSLAVHLSESEAGVALDHIYLITNAYWKPLRFDLPQIPGWQWARVVDTWAAPPFDIASPGEEPLLAENSYSVHERSTVVLLGSRSPIKERRP
jgi:isoamylase